MKEKTISVTYSADQIDELIAAPSYFSGPLPQVAVIETGAITIDRNKEMFWLVTPERDLDAELRREFSAWEAASDDDLANFENSL